MKWGKTIRSSKAITADSRSVSNLLGTRKQQQQSLLVLGALGKHKEIGRQFKFDEGPEGPGGGGV